VLAVIGQSGPGVLAAGCTTCSLDLAMAAFMLLIELTERIRRPAHRCWRSRWKRSRSRTSRKNPSA